MPHSPLIPPRHPPHRILIRWILAIPRLLIASILQDFAQLLAFFALFTILFTKNYPESLFRLVVGATRWRYNVTAYVLMHDGPYPPFSFDDGVYPHLSCDVIRQDEYSRWLPLVKWFLLIPHYIVAALCGVAALFVWLYAAFVVVVTGRFPKGRSTTSPASPAGPPAPPTCCSTPIATRRSRCCDRLDERRLTTPELIRPIAAL